MNQPLKELIHEKVEDSYTLKQDIYYAIVESIELDPDTRSLDVQVATDEIIQIIAEFVNQNYTPKPNKL